MVTAYSILVDRKCATIMPGSPVAVSALSGGGVTDLKLHLDPLLSLAPAQQPARARGNRVTLIS